jgi:hypothetical protein
VTPGRIPESPASSTLDLLQHLPHDDFDMLIVDLNALQSVNSLDFSDHIVLHGTHALDLQNIVRIQGTACQSISGADPLLRPPE